MKDKPDIVEIVDKNLQDLNPEIIEARKCGWNAKVVNLSKKTAKDTHAKKGIESKSKQSFWNEIKAPSQEPTDKRVREVRGTNNKSSRAFIKKQTTRKGGFIKEIELNMEVAKV